MTELADSLFARYEANQTFERIESIQQEDSELDKIIKYLKSKAEKNDFCQSLLAQFHFKAELSDKQIAAVNRMIVEDAEREKNRFDISKLVAAHNNIRANGLKRFRLNIGKLKISSAADDSMNPGYYYVKTDDNQYLGKIAPNGNFISPKDVIFPDNFFVNLKAILYDPQGEAIKHGKGSGECAVCARELTEPTSIERGIGPVCAKRLGVK